jgi:nucleotide-binding universal stress UspA family protein
VIFTSFHEEKRMAETAGLEPLHADVDFRIVVAVDLKEGTDRLLSAAERYGRAFNAIVNIVHVAAPDPALVGYIKEPGNTEAIQNELIRDSHAEALRDEHQQTQELGEALREKGIRVDALTVQGPTLATILDEAGKLGADLLILGSHHHNVIHRIWYGDTTLDAVNQSPCALLVVPIAE